MAFDGTPPRLPLDRAAEAAALDAALCRRPAVEALSEAARRYRRRIALVSSFGTQSAVLLHLVATADPTIPVILVDTGKLFDETLQYREALRRRLGLTDLRRIGPAPGALAAQDPLGGLWAFDPDACCALRKALPLARALEGIDLVITGRKRHQTAARRRLPLAEATVDGRLRLNPLADWDDAAIEAYRQAQALPAHPLAAAGYASLGCRPCTDRVGAGEDPRAGRWRGRGKTECGMHPAAAAGSV